MGLEENLQLLKEVTKVTRKFTIEELSKKIYNSVGIEGSTITEGDTLKVLTNNVIKHNYKNREIGEVKDLYDATVYMYENIDGGEISEQLILDIHSQATKSDLSIASGSYKSGNNYTTRKGKKKWYADCSEVEDLLYDAIDAYNESERDLDAASEFLIKFINIHPFGDGNGRVHRLLIDWFMLTQDFPPIEITKEEKEEYIGYLHDEDVYGFKMYLAHKITEEYAKMSKHTHNF